MIDLKHQPSKKDLTVFGCGLPIFAGLLGLIWWRSHPAASQWIWAIGGGVTLLFAAIPPARLPIYRGFLIIAFPIGWVISHVILALTYYLVLTPVGLALRILGRNPLDRKRRAAPAGAGTDDAPASYWSARPPTPPAERYFKQF